MTIAPVEYRQHQRLLPLPLSFPYAFAAPIFRRLALVATALVLPVVIVALWSLAARYELVAPQILPAPSIVWDTALGLIGSGQLISVLSVSVLCHETGKEIAGDQSQAFGVILRVNKVAGGESAGRAREFGKPPR